jgi:hypothetical protein
MPTLSAFALAAALLAPSLALAQNATAPPRISDVWKGKDHVLPRAAEHRQEKAAGVALPAPQRRGETDEVESLAKQLEQGTHEGPGAPGEGGLGQGAPGQGGP